MPDKKERSLFGSLGGDERLLSLLSGAGRLALHTNKHQNRLSGQSRLLTPSPRGDTALDTGMCPAIQSTRRRKRRETKRREKRQRERREKKKAERGQGRKGRRFPERFDSLLESFSLSSEEIHGSLSPLALSDNRTQQAEWQQRARGKWHKGKMRTRNDETTGEQQASASGVFARYRVAHGGFSLCLPLALCQFNVV